MLNATKRQNLGEIDHIGLEGTSINNKITSFFFFFSFFLVGYQLHQRSSLAEKLRTTVRVKMWENLKAKLRVSKLK